MATEEATEEWGYVTRCPRCGGQLFLSSATVFITTDSVPIEPEGFYIADADDMDTADETVRCGNCGYTGPLRMH